MASPDVPTIGVMFDRSWLHRIAALVVGLTWVAGDLFGLGRDPVDALTSTVLGALLLYAIGNWDLETLGIAAPAPGVGWWLRATLIVGGAFVMIVCAIATVLWALDILPPVGYVHDLGEHLWVACVRAPVHEEIVYRMLLCAPLVVIIGRWPTIIVSGVVFAFLHFHAGVLSVDNALAGLLLGWAYLRSGSIAVPIVLHALGNALVVAFLVLLAPHLAV